MTMNQKDILEVEFKMLRKRDGVKPGTTYTCSEVNEKGLKIGKQQLPILWLKRAVDSQAAQVFRIIIRAQAKKLQA